MTPRRPSIIILFVGLALIIVALFLLLAGCAKALMIPQERLERMVKETNPYGVFANE